MANRIPLRRSLSPLLFMKVKSNGLLSSSTVVSEPSGRGWSVELSGVSDVGGKVN